MSSPGRVVASIGVSVASLFAAVAWAQAPADQLQLTGPGPATALAPGVSGVPPATGTRDAPAPSWGKPLPYPIVIADRRNNRLLEVAPAIIAAAILWYTRERFPLTRLTYILILIHCIILMIGGHYTYALVPLGEWIQEAFDQTRNNYDKLGHLAQGFIPAIVAREMGTPCVVGTETGSQTIPNTEFVTVSCVEGEQGTVLRGKPRYEVEEINIDNIPNIVTPVASISHLPSSRP